MIPEMVIEDGASVRNEDDDNFKEIGMCCILLTWLRELLRLLLFVHATS